MDYHKFLSWSLLNAIIGFVLLVMGAVIYLCGEPEIGINYRGLLIVRDGSIVMLLGAGFFGAGIYQLFRRKKLFDRMRQYKKQQEEAAIKKHRKHYQLSKKEYPKKNHN
ncbi:MAG: hypothetical protein LBR81_09560 [Prevotellaceae bacterium]|jgi:hypothetical protein|nr:hypothetical protein [Prevotellaceae bacterium]